MNSNAKQQAHNVKGESGEDRISSLTDDVLCHILSFLPTNYAARTSVLSKRWEKVWTSVPNLDLDDSLLLHQGMLTEVAAQTCFSNFVNKVLSLHNLTCVKKFHLLCSLEYDSSQVDPWMCAAIMPHVEDLNLCINTNDGLCSLPQTFYYTCRNLVHLKLKYVNLVVDDSTSVFLPRLKTLRLSELYYVDDDSMKNLLSGCPALKDLCMERKWDDTLTLHVCSTSLERLTIWNCINPLDDFVYGLIVEAPKLKHLDLLDYTTGNYEMKNLFSLVSANIDVMRSDFGKYSAVIQILKDISNVKELQLFVNTIGDHWRGISYDNLPVFHNMTNLKVGVSQNVMPILPSLLERSPILKSLVIENEYISYCEGGWQTPDCVYGCLLKHLLKINIEGFVVEDDEIEMIGYFLKNSMVLEMMSIHSYGLSSNEKPVILQKLLMLPKGSSKCQIAFY